ncbi:MAG: DMT family transporter [Candidatus Bathyarchaeia archaeon]
MVAGNKPHKACAGNPSNGFSLHWATRAWASKILLKKQLHGGALALTRSHLLVVLACLGFSFILIFSTILKNTGISSLQQVLFRVTLALLFILIPIKGRIKLEKRDVPYFAATGLVFSAFLLFALSSIVFDCPVAVATALIYTQPFFTVMLSAFLGKEKVDARKFAVVALGIVGAFLVSGAATEPISNLNVFGLFLALLAGFLYAVYLYLKRMLKSGYAPLQGLFNTLLFATPCTLLLGFALRAFTENPIFIGFSAPDAEQFALLFLFAFFCTAMPYGLLNYVKPNEVSPTTEGTILLLDPVLHNLWAVLILRQQVSPIRYVGVGLILLSAAIMLRIKR